MCVLASEPNHNPLPPQTVTQLDEGHGVPRSNIKRIFELGIFDLRSHISGVDHALIFSACPRRPQNSFDSRLAA